MVLDASCSPSGYSVTSPLESPLPHVAHLPLGHSCSPRINRFPVRQQFLRTLLHTPEPPQTLSHHAIAHTFRHTWAYPLTRSPNPIPSLHFHSCATPHSPLATSSLHTAARKSSPFIRLLHSSLYTRVGSHPSARYGRNRAATSKCYAWGCDHSRILNRKRRSDPCQSAWRVK